MTHVSKRKKYTHSRKPVKLDDWYNPTVAAWIKRHIANLDNSNLHLVYIAAKTLVDYTPRQIAMAIGDCPAKGRAIKAKAQYRLKHQVWKDADGRLCVSAKVKMFGLKASRHTIGQLRHNLRYQDVKLGDKILDEVKRFRARLGA